MADTAPQVLPSRHGSASVQVKLGPGALRHGRQDSVSVDKGRRHFVFDKRADEATEDED